MVAPTDGARAVAGTGRADPDRGRGVVATGHLLRLVIESLGALHLVPVRGGRSVVSAYIRPPSCTRRRPGARVLRKKGQPEGAGRCVDDAPPDPCVVATRTLAVCRFAGGELRPPLGPFFFPRGPRRLPP